MPLNGHGSSVVLLTSDDDPEKPIGAYRILHSVVVQCTFADLSIYGLLEYVPEFILIELEESVGL